MNKRLFPDETNSNRAASGSKKGIEGRQYPKDVARRLNSDSGFVAEVCSAIGKRPVDFLRAEAGTDLPSRVDNVFEKGARVEPKVKLRIVWKDQSFTNFRVTTSEASQIHLEITENFIDEYEAQFKRKIPSMVKEALLLFSGRHAHQEKILKSIPIACVGAARRKEVEMNYFNRLTLASMSVYNRKMRDRLLKWLCMECSDIFRFCFALGASKDPLAEADFIWYRDEKEGKESFKVYNLKLLQSKIRSMIDVGEIRSRVRATDAAGIGSTIAFPFGNLQQHENKLQFRHDRKMIHELSCYVSQKKKNFGSGPKKKGHENEQKIAKLLNTKKEYRALFCDKLGKSENDFVEAIAGGGNAKQEVSVLGGKTPGKTDVSVLWKDGSRTNISVKMRDAGQVYLVSASNFIRVFQAQYQKTIPENVCRALRLFVGETDDSKQILESMDISVDGEKARAIACRHHHRLSFDVLRNYDEQMAEDLLAWLKKNIDLIFELCFSAGAVADRSKWSEFLWYKNLVDGNGLDYLVPISRIMHSLMINNDRLAVQSGPKNAGSTITLPFGFVEYHQKKLQFHQKEACIQDIVSDKKNSL